MRFTSHSTTVLVMLTLAMTSCGPKAPPAAAGPVISEHGTQMAKLKQAGQKYDVPALTGDVTCYEGTPVMEYASGQQSSAPEMYVRRAFDPETGVIVEDSVQISAGSAPKRFVSTFTPTGDEGYFEIAEAMGHWNGVMVQSDGDEVMVMELTTGSMVLTSYFFQADGIMQKSMVFTHDALPEVKSAQGLIDLMGTDEGKERMISQRAFTIDGLLTPMSADACANVFSYFPPEAQYF